MDLMVGDNETAWTKFFDELGDRDIAMLVNNVGYVNYIPAKIGDIKFEEIIRMANLNIVATTVMTHFAVKKMNERKGKSAIINLSSFMALREAPMLQMYGATKAYVKV